ITHHCDRDHPEPHTKQQHEHPEHPPKCLACDGECKRRRKGSDGDRRQRLIDLLPGHVELTERRGALGKRKRHPDLRGTVERDAPSNRDSCKQREFAIHETPALSAYSRLRRPEAARPPCCASLVLRALRPNRPPRPRPPAPSPPRREWSRCESRSRGRRR